VFYFCASNYSSAALKHSAQYWVYLSYIEQIGKRVLPPMLPECPDPAGDEDPLYSLYGACCLEGCRQTFTASLSVAAQKFDI
jgi:hypothetical protein